MAFLSRRVDTGFLARLRHLYDAPREYTSRYRAISDDRAENRIHEYFISEDVGKRNPETR